jgi:hypothetical protein
MTLQSIIRLEERSSKNRRRAEDTCTLSSNEEIPHPSSSPPPVSSDKGVLPTPLPTPHSFRATRRLFVYSLPAPPSPLTLNNGGACLQPHLFLATGTLSALHTTSSSLILRRFWAYHHHSCLARGGSASPSPLPHSFRTTKRLHPHHHHHLHLFRATRTLKKFDALHYHQNLSRFEQ